jgi:glyoxylase-like metal-dependent hydrolase (beta-lactamase superfamily II)
LTHAHPDHVAGVTDLVGKAPIPIVALASVERLMRSTEVAKRAQWGPIYLDEWIGQWTYPTLLAHDRDRVTFDDVTYQVFELGPGGDCDANSLWILETDPKAAFIGDLVFNGTHVYTADNHLLAWLANLEQVRSHLFDVPTLYPGHGQSGGLDLLEAQRDYLLAYCAAVKELAAGQPVLSQEAKGQLVTRMEQVRPGAGLTFLIGLGADAVAAELIGHR